MFYITLTTSYSLEIIEYYLVREGAVLGPGQKALVIINRLFSLFTELPLLLLQWRYVLFFVRLRKKARGMTCKNNCIMVLILVILAVNTQNSLAFNITSIISRVSDMDSIISFE